MTLEKLSVGFLRFTNNNYVCHLQYLPMPNVLL